MSERNKLATQRLMKEEAMLNREPIPNALVTREGHLNFHFCLYSLDGPYADGLYHGLFQLHENYPFNAPKLFVFTPSGRFEINLPICTSFTNYHQETWTSAWNVRSLILATISFMYSQEPSYGCRNDPEAVRRQYALNSKKLNFQSEKFDQLFGDKLVSTGIVTPEERALLVGKPIVFKIEQGEKSERSLISNKEILEKIEKKVRSESSERSNGGQLQEILINKQEEPNQQNEKEAFEQKMEKQEKENNNNGNDLRRVLLKGVVIVFLVAGVTYGVYWYFK